MRERYDFRELKATTLAHEYTLNRNDKRDKSSLAVLHLLELPEIRPLDPRGFGQSELKHPISFKVDGVYVPASVAHVTYLMAPKSKCNIGCCIDSTVPQPALFEHAACFIARIRLHEDSKPFHPKTGPGSGKPFKITIKEAGKADVVLHAMNVTDGVDLLKNKVGITTGNKHTISNRLSGRVASDFVKDGKTCKFAYTKVTLPKKEELEQDMYVVLPLNNQKLLEALREGFAFSGVARLAFMDLDALRADPLSFFLERDDIVLSDELKEIVARGFVTKKELKDTLLPYITGYKTRVNAQFDEFLPSETFIKAHVASPEYDEDAAALLNKVEAEMKWLYDAVDVFDKERAAAAKQRKAAKAAKASDKASPKKPGRKRKATVPKKTSINSDDASDEEMAAIAEEPAANAEDCVSDDDVAAHEGDSSSEAEFVEQPRAPKRSRSTRQKVAAAPPVGATYQVGDRVKARCDGSVELYPGTIDKCHGDGTYDIKFDDGDEDVEVAHWDIRRLP